jgi:hypothetical protein
MTDMMAHLRVAVIIAHVAKGQHAGKTLTGSCRPRQSGAVNRLASTPAGDEIEIRARFLEPGLHVLASAWRNMGEKEGR